MGHLWGYFWGYLRNSTQRNVSTIRYLGCVFESCCRTQIRGSNISRAKITLFRMVGIHCLTGYKNRIHSRRGYMQSA